MVTSTHEAGAREVLEQLRQAAINQSAVDMGRLYAADAVHEFPFTAPGFPSRLEGRDVIMNWIVEGWQTYPLRYQRYRTVAIHDTTDPDTIIVEQEALAASEATGELVFPNLMVLTVRNGHILRLRDYVNVLAAAGAIEGAHSDN